MLTLDDESVEEEKLKVLFKALQASFSRKAHGLEFRVGTNVSEERKGMSFHLITSVRAFK